MRWGSYVNGVQDDEQWVKVDGLFLPMYVNGIKVLRTCDQSDPIAPETEGALTAEAKNKPHEYLIDNSHMLASTKGVGYRKAKSFAKDVHNLMTGDIAEWGSHVHGFDEDDQWIKVGDHFLPVFVQGIRVISKCDEGSETLAEMARNVTFRSEAS